MFKSFASPILLKLFLFFGQLCIGGQLVVVCRRLPKRKELPALPTAPDLCSGQLRKDNA
jgi:hypothetical protein